MKQFAEIVRTLGFPAGVGIDSFDTPNFGLMAQLLQWLASLYDPDVVVLPDLSSEHGRVDFVRNVVQQMAVRSGIRLNPRKLYASDRFAVRELLKIAAPIYRGITAGDTLTESGDSTTKPPSAARISQLSATVPKHSVDLFDQLDREVMIREQRTKVLSGMPPLDEVEKNVLSAVDNAGTRLETLTKELDKLNSDEDTLRSKIKQRRHELERQSKRLMSVHAIRPAFMDEYEALEQELQYLFKAHFQHYRNVDFYEHELQKAAENQEQRNEQSDKAIKKMKKKVSKTIVGNVQQSFGLNMGTDQYRGGLGLDAGDDIGGAEASGSDDSF